MSTKKSGRYKYHPDEICRQQLGLKSKKSFILNIKEEFWKTTGN